MQLVRTNKLLRGQKTHPVLNRDWAKEITNSRRTGWKTRINLHLANVKKRTGLFEGQKGGATKTFA
jgi:hypothetical protein